MTIFAPPFTKKSPAARLKMRLPPALTLVVGAARPESATRLVSIIPVSHEGVSLTREIRLCDDLTGLLGPHGGAPIDLRRYKVL